MFLFVNATSLIFYKKDSVIFVLIFIKFISVTILLKSYFNNLLYENTRLSLFISI